MATQAQVKKYFETVGPIVVKVCKDLGYGNAQAWTCLAQGACESAYATSSLMVKANALFGIKANKAWLDKGGKAYNTKTKECYDGSNYVTIRDSFRAYDSVEESVRDYFKLISGKRYAASLKCDNVNDCITCIKNGGYATSPTYINTINTIFNNNKGYICAYTVDGKHIPVQNVKSDLEIAKEVVAGKWGNGADRKRALVQAGYNYVRIQLMVNELCRK